MVSAGLLGAAYCLFSDDSCSDAAAKVGYYGAQIAIHKKEFDDKNIRLNSIQQRYTLMEEEKRPFLVQKSSTSEEIEALKLQIDALACKRIFCL
jgi:hypothetical protein